MADLKGQWCAVPAGRMTFWVEAEQKAKESPADLPLEAHDVPSRLTFLRMLKERTIFGEHAVLSKIIEDYTWALRRRRGA